MSLNSTIVFHAQSEEKIKTQEKIQTKDASQARPAKSEVRICWRLSQNRQEDAEIGKLAIPVIRCSTLSSHMRHVTGNGSIHLMPAIPCATKSERQASLTNRT
jgi:hypothetical protein